MRSVGEDNRKIEEVVGNEVVYIRTEFRFGVEGRDAVWSCKWSVSVTERPAASIFRCRWKQQAPVEWIQLAYNKAY